ncbi:MAG: dephospho-CoA kinase [Myxococcales bacterium]|nr:dephospho-CoA kinase [Myxococcales bacterium]
MFRLFGLTGGVASGKSSVAACFRRHGLDVIDADALARELVVPGSEALGEIVALFGAEVLGPTGELDRARVGTLTFADADKRRRLNAILHPRIGLETVRRAAALEARGKRLACYEAALIVENGLADAFRPLVVVALPEPLQLARLMARSGLGEAEARRRIAAQRPLADKVAVADYVIDNSGTPAELEAEAARVLGEIRARFDPRPPAGPAPDRAA